MKDLFKKHIIFRHITAFTLLTFVSLSIFPSQALAQGVLGLPQPGAMVQLSPSFYPVLLKGVQVYPDNPLRFDFIMDTGDTGFEGDAFKEEASKVIKYFLAALTVPEDEFWVNLSPYEKDRIIADMLGQTEMGRDLLAQDYVLKQLSATLVNPDSDLGKKFWDRVYKKSYKLYGTTQVPANTFNKIWIVPDEALVYEQGTYAFVGERHLKVMLEEDYVAMTNQKAIAESRAPARGLGLDKVETAKIEKMSEISSKVVRDILIPEIEKEVNEGKLFSNLRQIFDSMILATWYKKTLKESLLGQIYVDQNKVSGIDVEDKTIKEQIYNQYLESFKKGVFDFVKVEKDIASNKNIPRKYFSGGVSSGVKIKELKVRPLRTLGRRKIGELLLSRSKKGGGRVHRIATNLMGADAYGADRLKLVENISSDNAGKINELYFTELKRIFKGRAYATTIFEEMKNKLIDEISGKFGERSDAGLEAERIFDGFKVAYEKEHPVQLASVDLMPGISGTEETELKTFTYALEAKVNKNGLITEINCLGDRAYGALDIKMTLVGDKIKSETKPRGITNKFAARTAEETSLVSAFVDLNKVKAAVDQAFEGVNSIQLEHKPFGGNKQLSEEGINDLIEEHKNKEKDAFADRLVENISNILPGFSEDQENILWGEGLDVVSFSKSISSETSQDQKKEIISVYRGEPGLNQEKVNQALLKAIIASSSTVKKKSMEAVFASIQNVADNWQTKIDHAYAQDERNPYLAFSRDNVSSLAPRDVLAWLKKQIDFLEDIESLDDDHKGDVEWVIGGRVNQETIDAFEGIKAQIEDMLNSQSAGTVATGEAGTGKAGSAIVDSFNGDKELVLNILKKDAIPTALITSFVDQGEIEKVKAFTMSGKTQSEQDFVYKKFGTYVHRLITKLSKKRADLALLPNQASREQIMHNALVIRSLKTALASIKDGRFHDERSERIDTKIFGSPISPDSFETFKEQFEDIVEELFNSGEVSDFLERELEIFSNLSSIGSEEVLIATISNLVYTLNELLGVRDRESAFGPITKQEADKIPQIIDYLNDLAQEVEQEIDSAGETQGDEYTELVEGEGYDEGQAFEMTMFESGQAVAGSAIVTRKELQGMISSVRSITGAKAINIAFIQSGTAMTAIDSYLQKLKVDQDVFESIDSIQVTMDGTIFNITYDQRDSSFKIKEKDSGKSFFTISERERMEMPKAQYEKALREIFPYSLDAARAILLQSFEIVKEEHRKLHGDVGEWTITAEETKTVDGLKKQIVWLESLIDSVIDRARTTISDRDNVFVDIEKLEKEKMFLENFKDFKIFEPSTLSQGDDGFSSGILTKKVAKEMVKRADQKMIDEQLESFFPNKLQFPDRPNPTTVIGVNANGEAIFPENMGNFKAMKPVNLIDVAADLLVYFSANSDATVKGRTPTGENAQYSVSEIMGDQGQVNLDKFSSDGLEKFRNVIKAVVEEVVLHSDQVGGIDLGTTSSALQIKRDGNGMVLPLNQQSLEFQNIQGFTPFIINVTTFNPAALLSQIEGSGEKESATSLSPA